MSLTRLALIAIASIVPIVASPLAAEAQTASWDRGDDRDDAVFVSMEDLAARVDRGALIIDYRVRGQDWRWMRYQRIAPALQVRASGQRLDVLSLELRRPGGQLTVPLPRGIVSVDEIEVSITGGTGRDRIQGMQIGGVRVRRLILPVLGAPLETEARRRRPSRRPRRPRRGRSSPR